jgi:hypothetical protein
MYIATKTKHTKLHISCISSWMHLQDGGERTYQICIKTTYLVTTWWQTITSSKEFQMFFSINCWPSLLQLIQFPPPLCFIQACNKITMKGIMTEHIQSYWFQIIEWRCSIPFKAHIVRDIFCALKILGTCGWWRL